MDGVISATQGQCMLEQQGRVLTFTPPQSFPSGQFWGIYALIWGVRVKDFPVEPLLFVRRDL